MPLWLSSCHCGRRDGAYLGHSASASQSVETTTCTSVSLSSVFNAGKVPVSPDFTAHSSDACPPPGKQVWRSPTSTQLTRHGLGASASSNKSSQMYPKKNFLNATFCQQKQEGRFSLSEV